MLELSVPRFEQDPALGAAYCGPASAQMVLKYIKAGHVPQELLFERIKKHKSLDSIQWHAAPDSLCATLEDRKPEELDFTFTMWALNTPEAMARKVCWSLAKHNLPPIVLLDGCHWVVVTGFEPTVVPKDVNDTSYQITVFHIHNPQPKSSPENISYRSWTNRPACDEGQWNGKHIVICDEDMPDDCKDGKLEGRHIVICEDMPEDSQGSARKPLGDRVDNLKAIARASHEIEEPLPALPRSRGGRGDKRIAPSETIGDPVLVERLDYDPPEYYYIVPIRNQKGKVTRLVNVSGHENGGVNGSVVSPGAIDQFMAAVSPQTVKERFAGREVAVGRTTITPQAEDLHANLVWQPCIETLSPYLPFYRFDVAGPNGETSFYVRIDGEFFPELHAEMGM